MNDEQSERRAEQVTSRHPSNLLYNNHDAEGNDLTFEQAMRYCIAQVDGELASWRTMQPDEYLSRQDIANSISDLEALKEVAKEALTLYQQHDDDEAGRDAVYTAFVGSNAPIPDWKQLIAEAVREDNYSGLAL